MLLESGCIVSTVDLDSASCRSKPVSGTEGMHLDGRHRLQGQQLRLAFQDLLAKVKTVWIC